MTAMANTGDRSWGHLATTERFGRTSSNYIEVPKEDFDNSKYFDHIDAGHCMLYSRTNERAFGVYNARAVCLMQMRFDGYLGFPGGLIDAGEDVVVGVNRELVEESNLDLEKHSVKEENHIVTHWCPGKRLMLHFYALEIPLNDLKAIEENVLKAEDYGEEIQYGEMN